MFSRNFARDTLCTLADILMYAQLLYEDTVLSMASHSLLSSCNFDLWNGLLEPSTKDPSKPINYQQAYFSKLKAFDTMVSIQPPNRLKTHNW